MAVSAVNDATRVQFERGRGATRSTLSTGETVFSSRARNFEDKIGLEHVDYFSSVEGIPLYRDHEYEIVTVYDNTSGEDQDSMAVMYLYLLDKQFEKPDLVASALSRR